MQMNDLGEVIEYEWQKTSIFWPLVHIDCYIIMPNHFHAIIILDDPQKLSKSKVKKTSLKPGSLGAIIGHFKSIITKKINQLRRVQQNPVWQRNFYDHIIRNAQSLDAIRRHIEHNPQNWSSDLEHMVGAWRSRARVSQPKQR